MVFVAADISEVFFCYNRIISFYFKTIALILGTKFKLLISASIRGVLSQRSSSDMQPDCARNPIIKHDLNRAQDVYSR